MSRKGKNKLPESQYFSPFLKFTININKHLHVEVQHSKQQPENQHLNLEYRFISMTYFHS